MNSISCFFHLIKLIPRIMTVMILIQINSFVWASDDLRITKWKILGPFLGAPRDGMIDHLLNYGGEKKIIPSDNQVFYSALADKGIVTWSELTDQTENIEVKYDNVDWDSVIYRFGSTGLINIGYATTEVTVSEQTRIVVLTRKVPVFFVNSQRYLGESYSSGFHYTPALLKKGANRILIKFAGKADRHFTFKMKGVRKEAIFIEDITMPDLIQNQVLKPALVGITLANTSLEWMKNLRLKVKGSDDFDESLTSIDPIPPLTIHKFPVRFSQKAVLKSKAPQKVRSLEVELFRGSEQINKHQIKLEIKKINEPHKKTFFSLIDGSTQYYSILYPQDFDPDKSYGVIFALHGASVEASHMAKQYSPKDWAFVVLPTNRRPYGFDWQDWGRLDFLEVLEQVKKHYPVDPERFYLAGSSMGGQGVWHIALHHPSLFAAAAPQAGWANFQTYSPFILQKSRMFSSPRILMQRNRAMMDSNNLFFLKNAQHLPFIVTQGAKDLTVPPLHARLFQKTLKELGYQLKYREIADKKHWWNDPLVNGIGADAIDNQEIISFLKGKRLKRYPETLSIHLYDLSINDEFYWIRVLRQHKILDETTLEAKVQENKISLTTKNVAALKMDVDKLLVNSDEVLIEWNGETHRHRLTNGKRAIQLGNDDPERNHTIKKTDYTSLKSVFFKPFVIVYGTRGDDSMDQKLLNSARSIASRFWRVANGRTRILRDVDLDNTVIREFNLILLGSQYVNRVTQEIIRDLPVEIGSNRLKMNGRVYHGDVSLAMLYPNPLNPKKMIALFGGTSPDSELLSLYFLPIYSGSGTPDYIIFNHDVLKYAWGGVQAAGFFNHDWDFEN